MMIITHQKDQDRVTIHHRMIRWMILFTRIRWIIPGRMNVIDLNQEIVRLGGESVIMKHVLDHEIRQNIEYLFLYLRQRDQ